MDYGIKPVGYNVTCKCGVKFRYTSCGTGPVNICDDCTILLMEAAFGFKVKGRDRFGSIEFDITKPLGSIPSVL